MTAYPEYYIPWAMDPFNEPEETFVIVPREKLSKEAFEGLVNEFILREGTDYGHDEVSLDEKRGKVLEQINARAVKIVFSSKTQNCTLMTSSEIPFSKMIK